MKTIALLALTLPALAFANPCSFGAASFEAQLTSLKDTQERRREQQKAEAKEREKSEIIQLGLDYLNTYAKPADQDAAALVLKRNLEILNSDEYRGLRNSLTSYSTLPKIVEGSVLGNGKVQFRQVGTPSFFRDNDPWSRNTWYFLNDSVDAKQAKELPGKLVVFFAGYQAHAGVVTKFDQYGLSMVNLNGEFEHHFLTGDRARYLGIGHLHIYDPNITAGAWKEIQTQLLLQPMLQSNDIISAQNLPQDWKRVDKDNSLFVTKLSNKKLTDRLVNLLRKKGTVKLLIVLGNLNKTGRLGPAEIVELVGMDVTAPEEEGKVGLIIKRNGGKSVRELYNITGGEYGPTGISQLFYLNE